MRPPFQERQQDYVLEVATLTAGGPPVTVPLVLDLDAPFVLRSKAVLPKPVTVGILHQAHYALSNLLMSYTGPNDSYVSTARVPVGLESAYYGSMGNPVPVFPQMVYPAGGVIHVELENQGALDITDLRVVFRGVKLLPWGVDAAYTYPAQNGGIVPYSYRLTFKALGGTEIRRNVPFIVNADGDFVWRSGQAGTYLWNGIDVHLVIRDSEGKAYSNHGVPVNVLFGTQTITGGYLGRLTAPMFACGTTYPGVPGFMCGASNPGLLYPEIYIPRNQAMYFDISRKDGGAAIDFPLVLTGAKVISK